MTLKIQYDTVISNIGIQELHQYCFTYLSTNEGNLFQSKKMMNISAFADLFCEVSCRIYEFFLLKLHETCNKKW